MNELMLAENHTWGLEYKGQLHETPSINDGWCLTLALMLCDVYLMLCYYIDGLHNFWIYHKYEMRMKP